MDKIRDPGRKRTPLQAAFSPPLLLHDIRHERSGLLAGFLSQRLDGGLDGHGVIALVVGMFPQAATALLRRAHVPICRREPALQEPGAETHTQPLFAVEGLDDHDEGS